VPASEAVELVDGVEEVAGAAHESAAGIVHAA
jgi:hypothetical protein